MCLKETICARNKGAPLTWDVVQIKHIFSNDYKCQARWIKRDRGYSSIRNEIYSFLEVPRVCFFGICRITTLDSSFAVPVITAFTAFIKSVRFFQPLDILTAIIV